MQKTLLRLATAGSVDDGKSTLIGRLLYESNAVFRDHYEDAEKTSRRLKRSGVDLALLMDGLSAEREQGITIDVAYRYFVTDKRRYIIADVPGHEQYTRNMVTGVSNADLVVILIDAKKGLLLQTKRHLLLSSLLGVPHVLVVVNKMDSVGYMQNVFDRISDDVDRFASKMNIRDLQIMPVSALEGDMVVQRGDKLTWYEGRTFLGYLENLHTSSDRNLIDLRFPVQLVFRPNSDFRGYAGVIESGTLKSGDEVAILPSGRKTKIKSLYDGFDKVKNVFTPLSVVATLKDDVDVSRGDMLVHVHNLPERTNKFDALLCWLSDEPLALERSYLIKHTTKITKAQISELRFAIDIDTLHREQKNSLELNDIGRVAVTTHEKIFFDSYEKNRYTGSFILIDDITKQTAAAGMIVHTGESLELPDSNEDEKK